MHSKYVDAANQYAGDVIDGVIPACKWIKLASKRHRRDLKKTSKKKYPYTFDNRKAHRACKFIEQLPYHKGKWAQNGETMRLEPWQCFFVCSIFGWVFKKTGNRRFRRAILMVPRKNGKSALAAGIALYMLCADGEFGAEIYSGATSQKQAMEVFSPAKTMAERSPDLLEWYGVTVTTTKIIIASNGSKFEPLIGNPGDGGSPHCAIIDEYHEHDSDGLVDTMETGMAAREQPLMLFITTAGFNLAGPCFDLQRELEKILQGTIDDENTFGLIYTIDKKKGNVDDWTSIDTIIKANPNWGVSVNPEIVVQELTRARQNPRKQAAFKTKKLNVWVGAKEAYFDVLCWENRCTDRSLKLDDFLGMPCYLALDLASRVDIAALEVLFPIDARDYVRFGIYYLPERAAENEDNPNSEAYLGWAEQGLIRLTEGEMIDFDVIEEDILWFSQYFEVMEVCYDPFQATMLVTHLMKHDIPVVEVRATVQNFSQPMKDLEGLILSGFIRHNGDPVMTWMLSNVVAKLDAKDNVYPRKERDENKIDGVIALLMALLRAYIEPYDVDEAINNPITVKLH